MTTPIFDFVKRYSGSKVTRFHMPGHKGCGEIGCEPFDITEISGADVLYSAEGIIEESENNLTALYGTAHSFYSTEGSTLAIKAMLALVSERKGDEKPLVLAARNVHSSFVRGAALLDLDVDFIYPEKKEHICSCDITENDVRCAVEKAEKQPCAVYVTSPDYLGNMLDIRSISAVCKEYGIPLLVDNAHGAYLKFLPKDMHPISLGAAMCADSAHKTLPVLTGGAYLHISTDFKEYLNRARAALSLFASTSPSYLTLSSLDLCNRRLSEGYSQKIAELSKKAEDIKAKIASLGIEICPSEPFKIVIKQGEKLANHLRKFGIEPEFADPDYTVLMLTPENSDGDFEKLLSALTCCKAEAKKQNIPSVTPHERVLSIRSATLAKNTLVSIEEAKGRICASPTLSCPPAVPIVISGERITADDIELFSYYGINRVRVVD